MKLTKEQAMKRCADAYAKHKHLKRAANEVGIPWQTVYVYLREMNIPVTGDKSTYGAPRDKLAAHGEAMFADLVPSAEDLNLKQFQPKVDFDVNGHLVDVKTAKWEQSDKKFKSQRWAFSIKKQAIEADFFVCFGLDPDKKLEKTFLIPAEMVAGKQTISVPVSLNSKWANFLISEGDLEGFFEMLPAKAA